jgi:hypothetical protein
MDCTYKLWKLKLAAYLVIVEEFRVTPLPPPPPMPPEKVSFADYVSLMAKWECDEFAPAVASACE